MLPLLPNQSKYHMGAAICIARFYTLRKEDDSLDLNYPALEFRYTSTLQMLDRHRADAHGVGGSDGEAASGETKIQLSKILHPEISRM